MMMTRSFSLSSWLPFGVVLCMQVRNAACYETQERVWWENKERGNKGIEKRERERVMEKGGNWNMKLRRKSGKGRERLWEAHVVVEKEEWGYWSSYDEMKYSTRRILRRGRERSEYFVLFREGRQEVVQEGGDDRLKQRRDEESWFPYRSMQTV